MTDQNTSASLPDVAGLDITLKNGIGTLALNRPDRGNAMTYDMLDGLVDAIRYLDKDETVRAIVLTGTGKSFCTGLDLSVPRDAQREGGRAPIGPAARVALCMHESITPLIAVVNGTAAGVGATITLPFDIRIADETARFAFLFARRGLVPEACSSWYLPRLVGLGAAQDWCMTGRMVSSSEALRTGLVQEVCAAGTALPRAHQIAAEMIETTSPLSVSLTRQLFVHSSQLADPRAAADAERHALAAMKNTPDTQEGGRAFIERRPALFTTRTPRDMPDTSGWWSS